MVVQESGAAVEEELRARLDCYPAVRYPMQHATAQFHLGVLMANAGRLEEAGRALETASSLFDPQKLPEEHAFIERLGCGAFPLRIYIVS